MVSSSGGTMEEGDENASALGLSPQLFVDEILDIIGDIGDEAFQCCLQEAAAPGVLGADKVVLKSAELGQGLNAINHSINDVLDKKMTTWEKYCLQCCFNVPEGFMLPEDDNSCAKEPHKDGSSDADLDVELESLRRKLENARKESENLQREMCSLGRQNTYKRKLDSSIAEIKKLFEDQLVQGKFQDLVKAKPILQQRIMGIKKKRTDIGSLLDVQVWNMNDLRDKKCPALDKCFAARTEDVKEIINILQNK